jgi:hypothetical protein
VNGQATGYITGILVGITITGLVVYLTAPAIAERLTVDAVNSQGGSLFGFPSALTRPLATQLGAIVRREVESALSV